MNCFRSGYLKGCVTLTAALVAAASVFVGCGATVYEDVARRAEPEGYAVDVSAGVSGGASGEGLSAEAGSSGTVSGDALAEGQEPKTILVYVCGAVEESGVVTLPEGSRVYEAIEAAGGFSEEADERRLNLAKVLTDGEQITVMTTEEAEGLSLTLSSFGSDGENSGSAAKVNINTADSKELQTLSGIGASRASDIIAYREANGAFASIEEIMKVSGIKDSLFNRIKDSITVR